MSEQGTELSGEEVQNADATAEKAVGDKMAEIFATNDARQQANEAEADGTITPDNPEGLEVPPGEKTVAEATTDENENPTLDDLKAARDEAANSGDYERAIELRDQIKELESAAPDETPAKGVLNENERSVMKDLGGWTDEDIATLETSNPAFAKLTAKKLADGYNALSLQFAQAARNGAPALVPPQIPPQNATTQQQTATLESLYKDLDKFSETAGNEMVERFIKPLKTEVLEPLRDVIQFVNEQRQSAVVREVNDAVATIAKGGFEKHYGNPDQLSSEQRENRSKLYSVADMIHAGATKQGVPMKYAEAIRRGHLILTADTMKAQARKELVKEVRTRSTQITARPSQRIPRVQNAGDKAAQSVVEKFWEDKGE